MLAILEWPPPYLPTSSPHPALPVITLHSPLVFQKLIVFLCFRQSVVQWCGVALHAPCGVLGSGPASPGGCWWCGAALQEGGDGVVLTHDAPSLMLHTDRPEPVDPNLWPNPSTNSLFRALVGAVLSAYQNLPFLLTAIFTTARQTYPNRSALCSISKLCFSTAVLVAAADVLVIFANPFVKTKTAATSRSAVKKDCF